MAEKTENCRYCGKARHPVEQCPRVKAIDYDNRFVDGPRIARIEFHAPGSAEAENIRAFFDRPWFG